MPDENKDNPNPQGEETPEAPAQPVSELDKVKAALKELDEKTATLKAENDRFEKNKGEELLSGSSGGSVDNKPKVESPKEYRDRIDKEISEGKHAD